MLGFTSLLWFYYLVVIQTIYLFAFVLHYHDAPHGGIDAFTERAAAYYITT